jgi:ABC-type molybdate transport system substrate-binding protein
MHIRNCLAFIMIMVMICTACWLPARRAEGAKRARIGVSAAISMKDSLDELENISGARKFLAFLKSPEASAVFARFRFSQLSAKR